MTVHAPVHPDAKHPGEARPHELLDDVVGEEGASRSQRVIGWLCALLTAALAVAAWRLL
jgi:hypothetical protein